MTDSEGGIRDKLASALNDSFAIPCESIEATAPPVVPDHALIRQIGRGSYGEVWLARNIMNAWRAVKVVHRHAFDSERPYHREFDGIRRFEPVSRSHPSQLNILHVGRNDEAGCFYYVMELADDVASVANGEFDPDSYRPRTLRADFNARGSLPFDECLTIGLALATALNHLHRHGLVHRDIKPSNIIFVNGIPKLADIGLVTHVEATLSFVGTEGYLPPEGPGTPQADIYSVGKVLYEMATGRDRQEYPELPTNLIEVPAAERALLAELNEIIVKACHADVKKRYRTAAELHAELALLQSGKSIARFRVAERRLRLFARAGAAVTIAALVAGGAWFWQQRQTSEARKLAGEKAQLAAENGRIAAENLKLAEEARSNAAESRENELQIREHLYAADIRQIQHALSSDNLRQALELLRRNIPKRGEPDLRGFEWRYLWQQCQSEELFALTGHTNTVGCTVAFSPDGRRVASGRSDSTVRIWDAVTHHPLATLTLDSWNGKSADYLPSSVSFSPGGDLLAIGCYTNVSIWDANTFKELRTLPGAIFNGRFSPNGRYLLTYSEDGVIMWETREWSEIARVQSLSIGRGPTDLAFAFSADNRNVGVVTDEGIKLFRSPGLEEITILEDRMPRIRFLAFSPDAKTLAACTSADGNVKLWDVGSRKELFSFSGHSDSIMSATYSPDGKRLATCSADQTVKMWDAGNGKLLRKFQGHCDEVWDLSFSPDGKLLASASKDGRLKVWNPDTPKASGLELRGSLTWGFRADGNLMAFTPRLLAFDTRAMEQVSGQLFLRGMSVRRFVCPFGGLFSDGVTGATFSWDKASPKLDLDLWDLDRRERVCSVGHGTLTVRGSNTSIPGDHPVFAPNKGLLITSPTTDTALWKVPAGSRVCTLTNVTDPVLSADEAMLATVNVDLSGLTIWQMEEVQPRQILTIKTGPGSMAFSPDGRLIAIASKSSINLWELPSGGLVRTLVGHKRDGLCLAFSPDGKTLASLGDDRTLRFWHVKTGLELLRLDISASEISQGQIRFSPDGAAVVAAYNEPGVPVTRVWPASLTSEIAVTDGLDHPIDSSRSPFELRARARALEKGGRLDEAIQALGEAIQLCTTNRGPGSLRFSLLQNRSRLHRQLGRVAEAGADNCARLQLSPRSPSTPQNLIDLSAYYTGPLHWDPLTADIPPQPFLTGLPTGVQSLPGLEGVLFDLRGVVCLNMVSPVTESLIPGIPLSAEGIPVQQKVRRLHFLQAADSPGTQGEKIASYLIRYVDGRELEIPVIYAQDLRYWKSKFNTCDLTSITIAWSGQNPDGGTLQLFACTWENPYAELEISRIDFISKLTDCAPFLVALTAE